MNVVCLALSRKRQLHAPLQGNDFSACIRIGSSPSRDVFLLSFISSLLHIHRCLHISSAGQARARIAFFLDFLHLQSRFLQTPQSFHYQKSNSTP